MQSFKLFSILTNDFMPVILISSMPTMCKALCALHTLVYPARITSLQDRDCSIYTQETA